MRVQVQMASAGWAAATCLSQLMCSGCWGHVAPRLECPKLRKTGERRCSVCCSQCPWLQPGVLHAAACRCICAAAEAKVCRARSCVHSLPRCRLDNCPPRSFPPFNEAVQNATFRAALVDKLTEQLRAELAPLVANASSAGAGAAQQQQQADGQELSAWEMVGSPHIDNPAYRSLDATVSRVVSRFLLNPDATRACVCGQRRGGGSPGAQQGGRRLQRGLPARRSPC